MDSHICALVLRACSLVPTLDIGKQVHDFVIHHKIHMDSHLLMALMYMYGQCGKLELAAALFDPVS
jgi:hypothetical protein